jgi:hypothetical protein
MLSLDRREDAMQFLIDLWLPIVVAAVLVFVVSSVIHMVLSVHAGDYGKVDGEQGVLDAMREAGVSRGTYMFPGCSSYKEMAEPEMMAKFERGPVGYMIVLPPGVPNVGKSLIQWFLLSIVIGVLAAYVGHHALSPGASFGAVLRITASVGIAGYALGAIQDSIWKGVPWGITVKFVIDGVLYGLATGIAFAWLWPAAV